VGECVVEQWLGVHCVGECVVEQWLGVHCVGECVVEQWLGVRRLLSNESNKRHIKLQETQDRSCFALTDR